MKKGLFIFNHFKEYASFCLLNNVEDVCHYYAKGLKELYADRPETVSYLYEISQGKLFKEWLELFLHSVLNDSALYEVDRLVYKWRQEKLSSVLSENDMLPSGILLNLTTCKNALINFLPNFTNDIHYGATITQELNIFGLEAQERIFKVYLQIQNEKLEQENSRLNEMNFQLQNALQKKKTGRTRVKKR